MIILGYKVINSGTDTYKGKCHFTNSCPSQLFYVAYNSPDNTFEDDIILESNNNSSGFDFCNIVGASAKQTGGTIKLGPLGYASGNLKFSSFTKTSTAPISLSMTSGDAFFNTYNSIWYGDFDLEWRSINDLVNSTFLGKVNFLSPAIKEVQFCSFNDETHLKKIGVSENIWYGGNEFNSNITIEVDHGSTPNQGNGITMGNEQEDYYYGDAHFIRKRRAGLRPSYSFKEYYYGNILLETSSANPSIPIVFGENGGGVIFSKDGDQSLCQSGNMSTVHRFNSMKVDKPSGKLSLSTTVEVMSELDLNFGIISVTDASKTLTLRDGAVVTGGNNDSFVEGRIKKIGNTAFTFPTGGGGYFYQPISISAPANSTDEFTAEYLSKDPQADGYLRSNRVAGLERVSRCEYWNLDRGASTTSSVFVTLHYRNRDDGSTCAGVDDIYSLVVSRWNGSQWVNHGGDNQVGDATEGSVKSSVAISSFSPFTLGTDNSANNPLPIRLLEWKVKQVSPSGVLLGWKPEYLTPISHFVVERKNSNSEFEPVAWFDAGLPEYEFNDEKAQPEVNYYRLKIVEKNKTFSYSKVISANLNFAQNGLTELYPNPTADKTTIKSESHEKIEFTVYNLFGSQVTSGSFVKSTQLDTRNWPKGIYLISVTGHSGWKKTLRLLVE